MNIFFIHNYIYVIVIASSAFIAKYTYVLQFTQSTPKMFRASSFCMLWSFSVCSVPFTQPHSRGTKLNNRPATIPFKSCCCCWCYWSFRCSFLHMNSDFSWELVRYVWIFVGCCCCCCCCSFNGIHLRYRKRKRRPTTANPLKIDSHSYMINDSVYFCFINLFKAYMHEMVVDYNFYTFRWSKF